MYYPRRFDYDTEEQFLEACEAFDNGESGCEDAAAEVIKEIPTKEGLDYETDLEGN